MLDILTSKQDKDKIIPASHVKPKVFAFCYILHVKTTLNRTKKVSVLKTDDMQEIYEFKCRCFYPNIILVSISNLS